MKPAPSSFDAANAPLDPGITRLEASAGTGKTYTLCALFLRLIAEAGLDVSSILVTTFTIPATAELRERIRSLLRAAVAMFDAGPGDHALLIGLHPRYLADAAEIRPRLERALRNFDDATVCTIHGFAHRLLQERAFESGVPFDAEPLEDQRMLLEEVAIDFWRLRIYPADLRLGAFAMMENLSAEGLAPLLATRINRPAMTVLPTAANDTLALAEAAMRAAFDTVSAAWREGEAALRELLATAASWAIGEMKKPEAANERLASLSRCLADPATLIADYRALDFFTAENVAELTSRRAKIQPAHPLFAACSEFAAARARWAIAFCAEFLEWAPAALRNLKAERNLLSFDDLLTRLRDALRGPTGAALVGATRQRFAAALVDEFQDTDPVQAEILHRLFAGHGRVYFIGDPKQAIYGFRGADVFSYLEAASHAEHEHQLSDNQRSVTPLVRSVNTIFQRNPNAFVIDGIDFHAARAAGRRDAEALNHEGVPEPAFRFWLCSGEKPMAKTAAHERLPLAVASAIVEQLSGGLRRGDAELTPSDFAVLTGTNREAQAVQQALLEAGLPAVVLSNASVFHAPDAREMLAILHALASPGDEAALRTALATVALGFDATRIAGLADFEWEQIAGQFVQWHHRWVDDGFFPAFRTLLVEWKIRPRLLALSDGERRLTNLLHLGELLHRTAREERLGPEALVRWLAVQMHPGTDGNEEHELRLESDADAVKVVTVHKSKGLEFGIVWLPFCWDSADLRKDASVTFHEPKTSALTLDLGSPNLDAHTALAEREELAEKARLLYVALTRARLQCHFVWGCFNKCANSAAAWVLHPPAGATEAVPALRARQLDDAALRTDVAALVESDPAAFAAADLPEPQALRYVPRSAPLPARQARTFTGNIRRDWAIGSFSSLTAGTDPELPDYDRSSTTAEIAEAATGIHTFPRGRRAGTCLHEIFEQLDFRDPSAIEPLVARKLDVFAFDRLEFRAAVIETVQRTLNVELTAGLRLSQVEDAARLNELEFHLPLGRLDASRLHALLGEKLPFAPFSGFLKGYIDLVFEHAGRFYIVDWKSNWLGRAADDYTPEAIAAEMRRHHYTLQYHFYALALHRHLASRVRDYDYERHFGGVFYIFLRGVDPDRPTLGIFRDTPATARIAALDQLISTAP